MVRKTKEAAQITRERILDAAEALFQARGVSRSSLHDIATAAGVTRGAVYWHFQDKGAVFDAMMERVLLPMEEASAGLDTENTSPTLPRLRQLMLQALDRVIDDAQVRKVLDIALHMVEYVDELATLRLRRTQIRQCYRDRLARALHRAQDQGEVTRESTAEELALGLHALLDGLIQNWLLAPADFDLRREGQRALDIFLRGLAPRRGAG